MPLDRIRSRVRDLFQGTFVYKAEFLEPVDWRAREFNSAADYVCNCVFAKAQSLNSLQDDEVIDYMRTAIGIQVFTDAGYTKGEGAAAFVVLGIRDTELGLQTDLLGGRGVQIHPSKSAFQAEVAALDMATAWTIGIAQRMCRRSSDGFR